MHRDCNRILYDLLDVSDHQNQFAIPLNGSNELWIVRLWYDDGSEFEWNGKACCQNRALASAIEESFGG